VISKITNKTGIVIGIFIVNRDKKDEVSVNTDKIFENHFPKSLQ
jgi:hypothetical protein